MNSKLILLVCLGLAVAVSTVSAGKGKGKGKWKGMGMNHNLTCKGEAMNMKEMFAGKKECWKEAYPDVATTTPSSEPSEEDKKAEMQKWKEMMQNQCVHVCSMKKQKILKDDGTYDSDGTNTYIKAAFPASVQAAFKTAMDECNTASSSEFSMDNKCAGYKKFHDCNRKKFFEICEIKMGKGKGGDEESTSSEDAV